MPLRIGGDFCVEEKEMDNKIIIRGAREHNLKNINVEIPKNKLVIFTGISGSGKSSLAFDTIYAEGQRRYVESLSSYARQFLGLMEKPDVDTIEGLSPAISINQKAISHNPRSTVGTVTEIYDYLRLLFAKIGHPHCPKCGREIKKQSAQEIIEQTIELAKKWLSEKVIKQLRLMILAPVVRGRKGEFTRLFENLQSKGLNEVRVDGYIFFLEEDFTLIKTNRHNIEAVIDRLSVSKKQLRDVTAGQLRARLTESIEQALELADGLVIASQVKDASFSFPKRPKKFSDHLFSQKFSCPSCNLSLPEIEPRTFSFNSPQGACPFCNGIGALLKVDLQLVLNPNLSMTEGGILPFAKMFFQDTWYSRIVKTVMRKNGFPPTEPLGKLTKKQKEVLFYGTDNQVHQIQGENRFGRLTSIYETFAGIIPELEKRHEQTESECIRREIEKYMRKKVCPACQGGRLKEEALGITIDGKSIVEVTRISIKEASGWLAGLNGALGQREKVIAQPILKEIGNRLEFLVSVGLSYLTIDRAASTLAVGEAQRIRLASQIGSGLTGVLYVLDEPTIGLHPRDNKRLIKTLKKLKRLGNTVIVVEHDREMIESGDFILDFGPGGGEKGGRIVAQGKVSQIKTNQNSLTGKYLLGKKRINICSQVKNPHPSSDPDNLLTLKGCSQYNLKNIDITFPLGNLILVTGVSGSGKSTLIVDTLYHALMQKLRPFHKEIPGKFSSVFGWENVDKVALVDQSPIGRTPRSNPVTYIGAFTPIRELFAQTKKARMKGYKKSRFSFNLKGGQCEACQGQGQIKIEMQFLPDVYVPCEVCKGKRYNAETLEVEYKGKNIALVLEMTVSQALEFFKNIPLVFLKLKTLDDVGLSYLRLGQPAPTLSGGEAQRVKLAAELSKKPTGKTLYILDEPTTGLHFEDLKKLLRVLRRLVNLGNTVIVIEHNLEVVKNADFIIDLGPEGGDEGGEIVAVGTPPEVAQNEKSYTGCFLKKILQQGEFIKANSQLK